MMALIMMKMILILLFLSDFWIKFEKGKALKKELNEELMAVAWHPKRWQNFCMSANEKKEIESIFTE